MSDDDEIRSSENDWYRQRLGGLMFCVMTAFAMLIIRLFHLQNVQGEEFRQRSEYNYIRLQSVDAPRGLIFDRNRKLLADNRPSLDLAIVLKDARPVDETIGKLSEYTNIISLWKI